MNLLRIARLIFAVLALVVLGASTEAKLSMYQQVHTPGANTWQVIKLREFRLAPVAVSVEVPSEIAADITSPQEDDRVPDITPQVVPRTGAAISQALWFRPPPSLA